MGTLRSRRRGRRRWVGSALLALGLLSASAVGAAPASAHNVLVSTSPAGGSTVAHTPADVVLTFDNPALQPGTELVISGPSGPAQQGPPALVNDTVSQPLRGGSPAGRYHVAWRATSVDGHPVSGQFTFTATAGSTKPAAAVTTAAPQPARRPAGGAPVLALLAALIAIAIAFIAFRLRARGRS